MIYKIIGVIITVFATSFIGENKSRQYSERVKYLENMQLCISLIENEIRYTQTPIGNAFEKICNNFDGTIGNILSDACAEIKKQSDRPLHIIWDDAVSLNENNLNKNDVGLLKAFGNHLGDSDVDGQLKNLNIFNSKISYNLDVAIKEKESNCKLCRSLGIYSGLLIAILFF